MRHFDLLIYFDAVVNLGSVDRKITGSQRGLIFLREFEHEITEGTQKITVQCYHVRIDSDWT